MFPQCAAFDSVWAPHQVRGLGVWEWLELMHRFLSTPLHCHPKLDLGSEHIQLSLSVN